MKSILILFALFIALKSSAQTDSTQLTITVNLPVKAVVLYGYRLSQQYDWTQRKAPDALLPLIGSGNQPDSIVTVTTKSGILTDWLNWLTLQPYGSANAVIRSILSNSPSITGYTALTTQVTTKASGNSSEKGAAQYVVYHYNLYQQDLTDAYNRAYSAGLTWIRN